MPNDSLVVTRGDFRMVRKVFFDNILFEDDRLIGCAELIKRFLIKRRQFGVPCKIDIYAVNFSLFLCFRCHFNLLNRAAHRVAAAHGLQDHAGGKAVADVIDDHAG